MPGKHVRFSKTNVLHSPPTPALSLSSLSPASSYEVLTPPSVELGLPGPSPYISSPYSVPYSPSIQPKAMHVRIHHLLEHASSIDFDMANHPSNISYHHHSISSRTLYEPATSPPLLSMAITTPHLLWTIRVSASNGSYITLGDVLDAIYQTLRTNVTSREFASLSTEKERRRASRAYEERYLRHRSTRTRDEEKRGGMKRVDFLMGLTRFTGLSSSSRGPDFWHLNFR